MNWGYSINKDYQIDYDKTDKTVFEELLRKEPALALCLSCGSCTATCTGANFNEINFRKIITLVKRGENTALLNHINNCMLCGKCKLVCPRNVNTRNVIRNLQNIISPKLTK